MSELIKPGLASINIEKKNAYDLKGNGINIMRQLLEIWWISSSIENEINTLTINYRHRNHFKYVILYNMGLC